VVATVVKRSAPTFNTPTLMCLLAGVKMTLSPTAAAAMYL